jgi:hypothetical protein
MLLLVYPKKALFRFTSRIFTTFDIIIFSGQATKMYLLFISQYSTSVAYYFHGSVEW